MAETKTFTTQKPLGFIFYNLLTNSYTARVGEGGCKAGEKIVAVLADGDILIYTNPPKPGEVNLEEAFPHNLIPNLRYQIERGLTPEVQANAQYVNTVEAYEKSLKKLLKHVQSNPLVETRPGFFVLEKSDELIQYCQETFDAARGYVNVMSVDNVKHFDAVARMRASLTNVYTQLPDYVQAMVDEYYHGFHDDAEKFQHGYRKFSLKEKHMLQRMPTDYAEDMDFFF